MISFLWNNPVEFLRPVTIRVFRDSHNLLKYGIICFKRLIKF